MSRYDFSCRFLCWQEPFAVRAIGRGGSSHSFECDRESGAFIFPCAFDANSSPMRLDHCFGNGQSESEAAEAPCDRALPLLEGVKHFVDLFRLNANAGVGNSDLDLVR